MRKITNLLLAVALVLVLVASNLGVGTSEAAAHDYIYKKYAALATPYGPWIDSSGTNGDIEDAMSNGLITYTGWTNYTFDANTGRYSLNGNSKTFTVGDHGPSSISKSFPYISEYKIFVGRELTYSPPENALWVYKDYKWDREGTRLSTGIIYDSFSAQPSGYNYSKGTYVADVQAPDGTYPNDGRHSDGYWYVKTGGIVNNAPTISITTSGNRYISSVSGYNTFTLTGMVADADADSVTVTASLGGVSKSTTVAASSSGTSWSLTWSGSEMTDGSYASFTVSASDSYGGTASAAYTGTVVVDKTPPSSPTIGLSVTSWTNGTVTATIAAGSDSGSGSGVSKTEYKIGSGSWAAYSTALTISNEGQTIIYARTVDKAGNVSEEASAIIKIDTVAPAVSVTPDAQTWTSIPIDVKIHFSDELSGVNPNERKYKLTRLPESPDSWDTAESGQTELTIQEEGEWYLHAKAMDIAGNEVTTVAGPFQYQLKPMVPRLKMNAIGSDWAEVGWSLPNYAFTGGYRYSIKNMTTGKSWDMDYPGDKIREEELTPGTSYQYQIKATNYVGTTEWSDQFEVLTLPATVDNLKVSFVPNNSRTIYVSFDAVASADNYILNVKDADLSIYEEKLSTAGTHQVTGLEPGRQYTVSVTAKNASGSGESSVLGFLSLPAAPGEFQSAQIRETEVELTWSASETASLYELLRDAVNRYSGPYLSSYTDTGLDSGTEYDYQLAAKNESGFGDIAYLNGVLTLPGKTELDVGDVRKNEVTLSIKNEVRGADGYVLLVNGVEEKELPAGTLNFSINSLVPGSQYTFEVYAENRSGAGAAGKVTVRTLPDKPDGLTITDIGETSAKLSWQPVPGADKYKITVTDGVYFEISGTKVLFNDLLAGTTYQPKVQAGNASGYGETAMETFLTLPASPNVRLDSVQANKFTLVWDEVTSAKKYVIYSGNDELVGETEGTSYTIKNLMPGETCTVYVAAVNETGEGKQSGLTQRTLPANWNVEEGSQQISIGARGEHSVVINIKPVDGADQYKIIDGSGNVIGIMTAPETAQEIGGLESAAEYNDWTVIPENDVGEGQAALVPQFVTLPSADFQASITALKQNELTITIDSQLKNETYVITLGDKELYRGKDKVFTVNNLTADQVYTFDIWTENSIGEKAVPKTVSGRTMSVPSLGGSSGSDKGGSDTVASEQPSVDEPSLPIDLPIENKETKESENNIGFNDIDKSFAKEEILSLYDKGIVKGVSESKFEPNREVTRVEFASMLVRALELQEAVDAPLTFEDVQRTAWYVPELGAAIMNGVARGFSTKEFRPNSLINREQAAKMIANAQYEGNLPDGYLSFKDVQQIAFWAKPEVTALTTEEVITGYPDNTFKPKRDLTREESAALIYRSLLMIK
ncbi:hypothetical protein J1TS5_04020 [Paenibacillus macerans]|uniref:fibronectin type III domain-containing protein n=1 Tax=Paenibacillus macerans TaxID=44252 RepID=UPI001B2B74E9|nr:fibronectin type III domain-containing protein [Paenibacillus macerans]GIP08232.1 hypothetical protein J1TS5_04020 [Paenibacillus macerans]